MRSIYDFVFSETICENLSQDGDLHLGDGRFPIWTGCSRLGRIAVFISLGIWLLLRLLLFSDLRFAARCDYRAAGLAAWSQPSLDIRWLPTRFTASSAIPAILGMFVRALGWFLLFVPECAARGVSDSLRGGAHACRGEKPPGHTLAASMTRTVPARPG